MTEWIKLFINQRNTTADVFSDIADANEFSIYIHISVHSKDVRDNHRSLGLFFGGNCLTVCITLMSLG